MSAACPLCRSKQIHFYYQDNKRIYSQCQVCELVFVDSACLPTTETEKAEYSLHQNDLNDTGYRGFLNRLATPLLSKLTQPSLGLDYGCGPVPMLASIMQEHGHQMQLYDPFFKADTDWQHLTFDFICCSEAIEHFHQPYKEWQIWLDRLKTGGWLAIMTKRVIDVQRFAHWHYKNDQTHVSFFSTRTFNWLALKYKMKIAFYGADVVLLQTTQETNYES